MSVTEQHQMSLLSSSNTSPTSHDIKLLSETTANFDIVLNIENLKFSLIRDIPSGILSVVFTYLPGRDLIRLVKSSKTFNTFVQGNRFAQETLRKYATTLPSLSELQHAHLNASLVKYRISQCKYTVNQVIQSTNPRLISKFSSAQNSALKLGFSPKEVRYSWFKDTHLQELERDLKSHRDKPVMENKEDSEQDNIEKTENNVSENKARVESELLIERFQQLAGLTPLQVEGLRVGMTRAQVLQENYSKDHMERYVELHLQYSDTAEINRRYDVIAQLTSLQLRGIRAGYSLEHVKHHAFSENHLEALKRGFTVAELYHLNDLEIQAVELGIPREKIIEKKLTQKKLTYELIRHLENGVPFEQLWEPKYRLDYTENQLFKCGVPLEKISEIDGYHYDLLLVLQSGYKFSEIENIIDTKEYWKISLLKLGFPLQWVQSLKNNKYEGDIFHITKLLSKGYTHEQIIKLSIEEIFAFANTKLTSEQVNDPRYTHTIGELLSSRHANKNYTFKKLIHLKPWQLSALSFSGFLDNEITLEMVTEPWFTLEHCNLLIEGYKLQDSINCNCQV